jgi:hypothetical protein
LTIVPLESKVKAKLRSWLEARKAYWFMPVQTGYGAATLDFLCCIEGRFIACETKRPGKHLTPRQFLVAALIRAAGGTVYRVTLNDDGDLVFEEQIDVDKRRPDSL